MSKVSLGPKPFLLPQPVALVGTMVDGKPNFMVAAWCGMANHNPPMVSLAVRPGRHTEKGIEATGQFSLNITPAAEAQKADYCGLVSGAKRDKSQIFSVSYGQLEGAPLIDECALALECKLVQTIDLPTHRLHLGEIIDCHAEESCLKDGAPDMGLVDPLCYSTSDSQYWRLGGPVGKAFSLGKELKDD